jgi:hypothetical protein
VISDRHNAQLIQNHTFTGRQHVVGDHDIEGIVALDVNPERFLETLLGHIDVVQILEDDASQKAHRRFQLVQLGEVNTIQQAGLKCRCQSLKVPTNMRF